MLIRELSSFLRATMEFIAVLAIREITRCLTIKLAHLRCFIEQVRIFELAA